MLYLFLLAASCLSFVIFTKYQNVKFDNQHTLPLRGVLALLIILHHVSQSLTYMIPEDSPVNILKDFDAWGGAVVSVFFFLSGYGLMTSYSKKGAEYLKGFQKKRFQKILIPFLLCSLLYCLYKPQSISDVFTIGTWKEDCPLLPASWFVIIILIEYLAFYIIAKVLIKPQGITFGMLIFSVVLFFVLKTEGFKPYWWLTLSALTVGLLVCHYEYLCEKWLLQKNLIVVSFIVLSLLYLIPYFIAFDTLGMALSRTVVFPIFIWQVIRRCSFPQIPIFNFLGKISYEIYLVQSAVLVIMFEQIGGHPILLMASVYIASIILAYITHLFIQSAVYKFL